MTVMKKSNKEDAVSPVIGVMLMLVVTIVIAAVVAAFASGLGTDMESAPTVVLDATVYTDGKVKLTSLSGDNLVLSSTSVKIQKDDGTQVGNTVSPTASDPTASDATAKFLTPGSTAIASTSATGLTEGKYVTVLVLYDGKHVILNEVLLVKKAA